MNKDAGEKNQPMILEAVEVERVYQVISQAADTVTYPVLKGISFQVQPGEFVGIMGRSGCGKTTLLKTLGMIDKPNEGAVFYKGVETSQIFGSELAGIRRRELAFVFQDYYLMNSLSVRENIMLPLILDEADIDESKHAADVLAERFDIVPLLNKKPYELSGGEKQRAAICRALVADPELILADEPTGNLDSNSSQIVIESLADINEEMGKTVLLVTHDPIIASYCKRILFIKDGELLEDLKKKGTREGFYDEIVKRMKNL